MIPLLRPSMTQLEKDAVCQVLDSGWLGMGPRCEEFEYKMAARYGRKHCITTSSATAALHLALLSHGVGPGDEVIVPALTFASTALAVTYTGAKPVFADVRADTLTLDWNDALDKATDHTKAVVPVDYAGYPACHRDAVARHVFPTLVQDAAHSCGGTAYGDEVCLSFHPVKNMGTGDGGAILTNDDEKAKRMRRLRWCGIDQSTWQRTGKHYSWDYDIQEVGYKYHWNDVQAAIGLAQLERLDEMNRRRREIAGRYALAFDGVPGVEMPYGHFRHTWHLFVIRVDAGRRDALIDHLAERGISAGVHYKPLTHYPMWADQETPPVTKREWRKLVSLPIFPDLTEAEQEQVINAVREFCEDTSA